jgi:hypothetical protein
MATRFLVGAAFRSALRFKLSNDFQLLIETALLSSLAKQGVVAPHLAVLDHEIVCWVVLLQAADVRRPEPGIRVIQVCYLNLPAVD